MSLFMEGVISEGGAVTVWALPRGKWSTQRFESPQTTIDAGIFSLRIRGSHRPLISVIFCFHWIMLPVAVVVGMLRRVPVIYDEHDHYEINTLEGGGSRFKKWMNQQLVRWVHRTMLPFVSMVTCIHLANEQLKKHLQQWQANVVELHNFPVRAWKDVPQNFSSSGKLCFVYMGGIFAEKGVGQAAIAFQKLPDHIRDSCELHIFGDGDRDLLTRLHDMPNIILHNNQSPEQLRKFASQHRCCGLVLYNEHPRYRLIGTNSRKLYEYLALGMPVIATSVGELPRLLLEHNIGILIHARIEIQELTAAMYQIADEPGSWNSFSQHARDLMNRPEMTWEHEWDKVLRSGFLDPLRKAA
ncbi:MAG: glycosyltransferase family 4 protein [Planctomyces sp.]|nr:glycosyltransferase family 4 protein [Planctomyces sp.]